VCWLRLVFGQQQHRGYKEVDAEKERERKQQRGRHFPVTIYFNFTSLIDYRHSTSDLTPVGSLLAPATVDVRSGKSIPSVARHFDFESWICCFCCEEWRSSGSLPGPCRVSPAGHSSLSARAPAVGFGSVSRTSRREWSLRLFPKLTKLNQLTNLKQNGKERQFLMIISRILLIKHVLQKSL